MPERSDPSSRRRRRADAEQNVTAILGSAARLLGERPDASVEEIAAVAKVTRQTVYAHFSSREKLVRTVVDHVTAEVAAAMDAAGPDEGTPGEALVRLLDASWQVVDRYPYLFSDVSMGREESDQLHQPILERLGRVVRRGQDTGEFDRDLPEAWVLAVIIGLSHAAAEQVETGRLSAEDAADVLRRTIFRAIAPAPADPPHTA